MTRVTNELRRSMLHRIMHGLPNINYRIQIHALVQDVVIKEAPKQVQAMYADEALRPYLGTVNFDLRVGNESLRMWAGRDNLDRLYGLTTALSIQMDERAETRIKEGTLFHKVYHALKDSGLVQKHVEQEDLRESVERRVRDNLDAAKTTKQLYEVLEPELHHFIPTDPVKANLPATVAPVVDDLRKLGADLPTVPKVTPVA